MAANTTVKVATLTGAAKDDVLTGAMTGLTEDHLSASLNVLANDPGAAKLYSLAQDASALASTTQFPIVNTVTLASGATISINADGTIAYNAGALSASLQSLAQGETFTDTFVYTVRMANGALSTAKVVVSIDGVNDAPTLASVTPVSIFDTAADDTPAPVTGTLIGHDVDHGAVLAYAFADGSVTKTTEYGTMKINAQTGVYSFTADPDKINTLALGEQTNVSFDVKVADEHGASASTTVKFTLVGANDDPTLAAVAAASIFDTSAIDNPAPVTGTLVGHDVDHGAVLSYAFADGSLTSTNAYGTMTVDAQTGAYSFTADAGKLNALALGEQTDVSFDVKVTDEHGASASTTVKFTLVGANDDPTLAAVAAASIFDTSAIDNPAPVTGTLVGHDVDHGAVLSYAFADGSLTSANDYGTMTVDAQTGAYSFTADADKLNALALGEQTDVSFDVKVADENGASASTTVKFTLVGANDDPTLAAVAATSIVDTAAADTPAPVTGTLAGHDVDHGAVLSYAFADGSLTSTNAYGTMTIDAQTGAYSFVANGAKLDSLAAGVDTTASFDVKVADEHGASAATTVNFDLIGANDTAQISGTATGAVAEDGTLVTGGALSVTDRDAGQVGFQAPASLAGAYGDFTFDAASGAWTYTLRNGDANVQALATGTTVFDSLTVQSFDGSASEIIKVSIAGADEPVTPPPAPNTPPPNPVVTYMVNHGQTFENGKWLISGFDSNDVLAYAGSYKTPVISVLDFNSDGTLDTVVHFAPKSSGGGGGTNGVIDNPVDVVLLGFSTLAVSQVVHA